MVTIPGLQRSAVEVHDGLDKQDHDTHYQRPSPCKLIPGVIFKRAYTGVRARGKRAWYEALGGRGLVSYATDSPPQPDLLPTTERLQPTRHCYD